MNFHESEMFDFAYKIIQSAGIKLKLKRKRCAVNIMEKTSQMDLVTEQDMLIEKYLAKLILGKYPGHTVMAEELHHTAALDNTGYTWIIDPIDGTTNYYRFARDYAISVALYKGTSPVFGLVYDVANNIMHNGKTSEPRLNSCNENTSVERNKLNKAVVVMSIRTIKELSNMGADVFGLLSRVQAHRYLGCASLELCKIASGEYDLFISSNVYLWDVAAAGILVEQSGGYVISCEKEKKGTRPGKLFTAAFRSAELWEEALSLLPVNVKIAFGC